ncbi:hypothetical protein CMO88_05075 [Candidatus Woesearchaeota archaeon]|nr:hypothetical protein [Candidatus Woesearchaeota archaeon]|tara:strand:- start:19994 stop:20698 length:705 start_codon:yes stop_codon:yes gene_type:complete
MARVRRKGVCIICSRKLERRNLYLGKVMRQGVYELVKNKNKEFGEKSKLCGKCLSETRAEYIIGTLKDEEADISHLEKDVLTSIKKQDTITRNIYKDYRKKLKISDAISDKLAEFGGSWTFIIMFGLFLAGWIMVNIYLLSQKPFDPYPFILLNLILSTLAAIQAPIIMMSQNRQESRDRLRSEHDYKINLKAELEIRYLHEKIDLLLKNHWNRLLQIQQMQVDVLEEIKKRKK